MELVVEIGERHAGRAEHTLVVSMLFSHSPGVLFRRPSCLCSVPSTGASASGLACRRPWTARLIRLSSRLRLLLLVVPQGRYGLGEETPFNMFGIPISYLPFPLSFIVQATAYGTTVVLGPITV